MPEEPRLEKAAGVLADLATEKGSCPQGTWTAAQGLVATGPLWNALTWSGPVRRPPLVQCITNQVSMDLMANVLLAARCSPAMVSDATESAEFASKVASAVRAKWGAWTTLASRCATSSGCRSLSA